MTNEEIERSIRDIEMFLRGFVGLMAIHAGTEQATTEERENLEAHIGRQLTATKIREQASESHLRVFDFLRQMRALYGTDTWCSVGEVAVGLGLHCTTSSTIADYQRSLAWLVFSGWVEMRETRDSGFGSRVEYRPVIGVPRGEKDRR